MNIFKIFNSVINDIYRRLRDIRIKKVETYECFVLIFTALQLCSSFINVIVKPNSILTS